MLRKRIFQVSSRLKTSLLFFYCLRYRISHYRTYRCWSRYRCRFRSSYIRCGKKPLFKRTIIFLCNFRICFFRSYWIIRFDDEELEFDSYLVPDSDLEDGGLRLLELNDVRFIISSGDAIHSYACPALGIKCDAYPGRLNQVSVLVNREGSFFGQCSEICGILHSSMPIVIESISLEKFLSWLQEQ
jgi:hypothetical protein